MRNVRRGAALLALSATLLLSGCGDSTVEDLETSRVEPGRDPSIFHANKGRLEVQGVSFNIYESLNSSGDINVRQGVQAQTWTDEENARPMDDSLNIHILSLKTDNDSVEESLDPYFKAAEGETESFEYEPVEIDGAIQAMRLTPPGGFPDNDLVSETYAFTHEHEGEKNVTMVSFTASEEQWNEAQMDNTVESLRVD